MEREDWAIWSLLMALIAAVCGTFIFASWQANTTKRACIEAGHDPLVCEARL